jgi:hypothetical protein
MPSPLPPRVRNTQEEKAEDIEGMYLYCSFEGVEMA